jgi:cbb3-type cytochrome oxidase maturation protein
MSAIYLLISLSLLVALGFLAAFIWAVRSGQYEDTYTPSLRILSEHTPVTKKDPPAEQSTVSISNER